MKRFRLQQIEKSQYTLRDNIVRTDNIQELSPSSQSSSSSSSAAQASSSGTNARTSPVRASAASLAKSLQLMQRPCYLYQDCVFASPVKLRCIVFRNYYCESIAVLAKRDDESGFDTILPKYLLMRNAHFEDDAQNKHIIDLATAAAGGSSPVVRHIRLVFFQPSPAWKNICIRDVQFFTISAEDDILHQLREELKHPSSSSSPMPQHQPSNTLFSRSNSQAKNRDQRQQLDSISESLCELLDKTARKSTTTAAGSSLDTMTKQTAMTRLSSLMQEAGQVRAYSRSLSFLQSTKADPEAAIDTLVARAQESSSSSGSPPSDSITFIRGLAAATVATASTTTKQKM